MPVPSVRIQFFYKKLDQCIHDKTCPIQNTSARGAPLGALLRGGCRCSGQVQSGVPRPHDLLFAQQVLLQNTSCTSGRLNFYNKKKNQTISLKCLLKSQPAGIGLLTCEPAPCRLNMETAASPREAGAHLLAQLPGPRVHFSQDTAAQPQLEGLAPAILAPPGEPGGPPCISPISLSVPRALSERSERGILFC